MKHNVHLIAAVRVTVYNVEADTHRAAADVAMAEVEDFYSLFDRTVGEIEMEYNEDILACLVDEVNDEDYDRSEWLWDYARTGEKLLQAAKELYQYVLEGNKGDEELRLKVCEIGRQAIAKAEAERGE